MRGLLGEQPPFSKVREQDGQHEQEKGTSRDRDNGTRRGDRGERREESRRGEADQRGARKRSPGGLAGALS